MPRQARRGVGRGKGQGPEMAMEEPAPIPPDRTDAFRKTKMCKFQILGVCAKGASCQFAHDKTEMNNLPDLMCTKLCKTLINTGSCTDEECKYAHTKEELRVPPPSLLQHRSFSTAAARLHDNVFEGGMRQQRGRAAKPHQNHGDRNFFNPRGGGRHGGYQQGGKGDHGGRLPPDGFVPAFGQQMMYPMMPADSQYFGMQEVQAMAFNPEWYQYGMMYESAARGMKGGASGSGSRFASDPTGGHMMHGSETPPFEQYYGGGGIHPGMMLPDGQRHQKGQALAEANYFGHDFGQVAEDLDEQAPAASYQDSGGLDDLGDLDVAEDYTRGGGFDSSGLQMEGCTVKNTFLNFGTPNAPGKLRAVRSSGQMAEMAEEYEA